MSRKKLFGAMTAVWMTAFVVSVGQAQSPGRPALLPSQARSYPTIPVGAESPAPNALQPLPGQAIQQYPHTGAGMYPSPVPHVPHQVGGTMITNQALAPHEMLYPHRYKALYPPFYYQVKGGWYLTPWGVRSYDTWKLQGTMVKVNYKSHYAPFSGFMPHR